MFRARHRLPLLLSSRRAVGCEPLQPYELPAYLFRFVRPSARRRLEELGELGRAHEPSEELTHYAAAFCSAYSISCCSSFGSCSCARASPISVFFPNTSGSD